MSFKVYKKSCDRCLLSKNPLVSNQRRRDILNDIKENQSYFVCHKSSIEGGNVCCKTFYDKLGYMSQLIRITERLNCVEFVEQNG